METNRVKLESMSEQELFDWFSSAWASLSKVAMQQLYSYTQNPRKVPPLLATLYDLHSAHVNGHAIESPRKIASKEDTKAKQTPKKKKNKSKEKKKGTTSPYFSPGTPDGKAQRMLLINQETDQTMAISFTPGLTTTDDLFQECERRWVASYTFKYKCGGSILKPGKLLSEVSSFFQS